MAFSDQIAGITSLSIGTTPTPDEVSQFLVDGTKDVVNRIISIKPGDVIKFSKSTHDNSDAGVLIQGQIISVVRQHDSGSIVRPCSLITPQYRYEASDANSLHYRSKYNPGFYQLDGKVHTVPASAGSSNDSIVMQVAYATNTVHSGDSIDNFPAEYLHLVVLYASSRSILAYMANIDTELPSDLALPVVPTAPTLSSSSVASLATAPTYTKPTSVPDIAGIDTKIADDDPELADSVRGKVGLQINQYQADIQNELNEFTKENAVYQAELQKKVQDAQLSSQDDAQKIQKYGGEVQEYSANVQSVVSDYNAKIAKLNTKYQWANGRYIALRQEYNDAFGLMAPPQQKKG